MEKNEKMSRIWVIVLVAVMVLGLVAVIITSLHAPAKLASAEPQSGEQPQVGHVHNDVTFTAWESTNSLPTSAGNYYLTGNVTLGGTWNKPGGTVNLCLNGYGIKTTSGRVIYMNGGILNLYDCGDHVHYFDVNSNGQATNVNDESGEKSFEGGYITGGSGGNGPAQTSLYWGEGGGILVWSGTFNMYGGTILGNYAGHGGGVEVVNATMNMYGGTIMYNRCGEGGAGINLRSQSGNLSTVNVYGGNVCYNKGTAIDQSYCYGNRALNLYGGNISHNKGTAIWCGSIVIDGDPVIEDNTGWGLPCANLSIKGSPVIRGNVNGNIRVNTGSTITIAGALDIEDPIGVTMQAGTGVFTSKWSTYMSGADVTKYFTSDVEEYIVLAKGREVIIYDPQQYVSLDPTEPTSKPEIELPGDEEDLEDGDVLVVDTDATPVVIKWYYDDDGDGTPDDPDHPIGEGPTYTIKCPDDNDPTHDDTNHTIISVITQEEDENGDPYPDEDKPTVTSDPIKIVFYYDLYIAGTQVTSEALSGEGWSYAPKTNTLTLDGFTYEGDEGVDHPNVHEYNSIVTYAGWDHFTLILMGKNKITNTKGEYANIMAFLSTGDMTIGGTGSLTLSVTGRANTLSAGLCAYADLLVKGGTITANGGASEWFSAGICVWGKRYIQKGGSVYAQGGASDDEKSYGLYALGRAQESTALGEGEGEEISDGITIFPEIDNFDSVGNTSALYTEGGIDLRRFSTAWTDTERSSGEAKLIAGEYENADFESYKYLTAYGFVALDPATEPEIKLPEDEEEAENGDTLTVDTDAKPLTIKWYYDDDGDGNPDDPDHPIGEGPTYTIKCPDDNDPTHDDTGHRIIAVITQDEDENGDAIPDAERVKRVTDPVKVEGELPVDQPASEDKWTIQDEDVPDVTVEIVGADDVKPEKIANVKVEVTVKAEVEAQVADSDYKAIEKAHIASNEKITFVYEVKLIQKVIDPVTGAETTKEIQPSDIKEGATVKVLMTIPEEVRGKAFKLLHIHSENDIEFIRDYEISADGKTLTVEIDRLSEFAFVTETEVSHGFCIGWLAFIFVMLELLFLALYFILWFSKTAFIVEKCHLTALMPKRCLLGKIGSAAALVIFIFALVALCVHQCAASIVSFILALLILAAYIAIFVIEHTDLVKGWLKKLGEFFSKVIHKVGEFCSKVINKVKALFNKQEPEVEETPQEEAVIAASAEERNVGFYRITKDEEGKCTFALMLDEKDHLSKEMGVFESEKAAYLAIKKLWEKGVNAKAENLVKAEPVLPAPKFVLKVNNRGVYRYYFIDEQENVLLESVTYLNEKRCMQDLKKALVSIMTEEIVVVGGIVEEEISQAEPVAEEPAPTPVEQPAEEPVEQPAEVPVEEPVEEPKEEPVALKETIEVAKATVSHSKLTKKTAAEALKAKYAADVECNMRANETRTGLPLADTHYAVLEDKKVCFAYVYEVGDTLMMLVKVDEEYGQSLAKTHPLVKRSAFPKSKSPWYSVIVDDSFKSGEAQEVLDEAYLRNGGKPAEGATLKQTLAEAKATTVLARVYKKDIVKFLKKEFGDEVEVNTRGNLTRTKLPLADTHYALGKEKKTCFVYVYETEAATALLLRLTEAYAESVSESGHKITRSAFPKSKDQWYSVILDDTYTQEDLHELLTDAFHQAQ